MQKMRKFEVIIDDGEVFKVHIPAQTKKLAKDYCLGNGRVVECRDVTPDYPISLDKVVNALKRAEFGQVEIDLIMRTLLITEIAE